jgi:hypothetical protein
MSTAESGQTPGTELSRVPFTVDAEKEISSFSFWLAILGWIVVLAAVIDVISIVFTRNFSYLFNALLHGFLGAWCLQGAQAFKKVATTDVADQEYLVQGFSKLRNIFLLQGILIVVALAFIAAALLFAFIHGVNVH